MAKAQRYEIGAQVGASNLVGDIGRTNYIYPLPTRDVSTFGLPFYGGLLFRMNFNPQQTLRLNLGYSHIFYSDRFATEDYRRTRRNSSGEYFGGTQDLFVGEVLFEYNFFPINNEQKHGLLSPYIFAGIGAMLYNQQRMVVHHNFNKNASDVPQLPLAPDDFVTTASTETNKSLTLTIPFGVGLKYKFNYNWMIFGEFTFRSAFVDDLDASRLEDNSVKVLYDKSFDEQGNLNPTQRGKSLLQTSPYAEVAAERVENLLKQQNIGNLNSNDWINTMSIGVTYSFGRPPCYCEQ